MSKISNSVERKDNFLAKARKLSILPTSLDTFDIRQLYIRILYLSHCFQCNTAITNFLISNTCEIRFHDIIGQSAVPMYSYAKIQKHGRPPWPNKYVLDPYFSI